MEKNLLFPKLLFFCYWTTGVQEKKSRLFFQHPWQHIWMTCKLSFKYFFKLKVLSFLHLSVACRRYSGRYEIKKTKVLAQTEFRDIVAIIKNKKFVAGEFVMLHFISAQMKLFLLNKSKYFINFYYLIFLFKKATLTPSLYKYRLISKLNITLK